MAEAMETIESEFPTGEEENWAQSTDPAVWKKWRSYAKSSHTKTINKLFLAIREGSEPEAIRKIHGILVRNFEDVSNRHDRFVTLTGPPPDGDNTEAQWIKEVTEAHSQALKAASSHFEQFIPPTSASVLSRISSARSTSSTRSRLNEAKRLGKEAELKLRQTLAEERQRKAEEEKLKELEEERRRIESERKIRAIEDEIEKQRLNEAILQEQLMESPMPQGQLRVPIAPAIIVTDPEKRSISPNFPLQQVRQAAAPNQNPTPAGTFGSALSKFRNYASKTIEALTPRRPQGGTSFRPIPFNQRMRTETSDGPADASLGRTQVAIDRAASNNHRQSLVNAEPKRESAPPNAALRPGRFFEDTPLRSTSPLGAPALGAAALGAAALGAPPLAVERNDLPSTVQKTKSVQLTTDPAGPNQPSTKNPVKNESFPSTSGPPPLSSRYLNAETQSFFPDPGNPSSQALNNAPSTHRHEEMSHAPDAWIGELGTCHDAPSKSLARLPKIQMPSFDGNPKHWPMFISSFKIQVHDATDSDALRVIHLRNCLTGRALLEVGSSLDHPNAYRYVLEELQRKFGNAQLVSQACTLSLLKLKPFGDDDGNSLRNFSSQLRSVVATLQLGGYGMELHSNATLLQLVEKLPPSLKRRWGEVSWNMQPALPTILDFDAWLDYMSMSQFSVLSTFPSFNPKPKESKPEIRKKKSGFSVYATSSNCCKFCSGNHFIASCFKFKELSVEKRAAVVKEHHLCYRCLADDHVSVDCKSVKACQKEGCRNRHHVLLHNAPRLYPPKSANPSVPAATTIETSSPVPFSGFTVAKPMCTMLPIVPVIVKSHGRALKTFALLDNGSEVTLIRDDFARLLSLKGPVGSTEITTVSGKSSSITTRRVAFTASSTDDEFSFQIEDAYTVPTLNLTKKEIDLPKVYREWPHLAGVKFSHTKTEDVTLLLGIDQPAVHEVRSQRVDPKNQRAPRALLTCFGWCLVGPLNKGNYHAASSHTVSCHHTSFQEDGLNNIVRDFFHLDQFGVKPDALPPISKDDARALQILEKTTRHNGERYEAGLLWASDSPQLPDNRATALRRLQQLEKRFRADPVFAERYANVINEYVELRHARKLSAKEIANAPAGRTNYLPHHPVINPNKPGKFRVVFDGSSKTRNISLNDCLMKGPDFLSNLPGALLRFRQFRVPVVSDIEKMFPQVRVRAEDGPAFRFLWRPPGTSNPPDEYQMDVQIFGATSSPAICGYVLRQAAKDSGIDAPIVLREVEDHFYVDNWLVSYQDEEEAITTSRIVSTALLKGGFKLTQWASSNHIVRSALGLSQPESPSLNLDLDSAAVERTLGLSWDMSRDVFTLKVKLPTLRENTKRSILRATATIFDPLGFLSPVIFVAKNLLQDIWRIKADWDDPLEETLVRRWKEWATSLSSLESLTIERCIMMEPQSVIATELHLFADASESGFGAVAYARIIHSDLFKTSFLKANTRVASVKFVTIPRLELCAAVMAVRLFLLISREMRITFRRVTFWTDSTTVLRWINSPSCKFQTYVGNRLGELLESSTSEQWRYVPSKLNPADDASRGLNPTELSKDHRWFRGPPFLLSSEETWPEQPEFLPLNGPDPEIKLTSWIGLATREDDAISELIERKSQLSRVVRVVALVRRWITNSKVPRNQRISSELHVTEVQKALELLIRKIQKQCFPIEFKCLSEKREVPPESKIISLAPYLNHHELMCVGGRIEKAPLPLDSRHPLILPPKHRLTELIVLKIHFENAHPSAYQTHVAVRRQYWIPKGLVSISRVLKGCFVCRKFKAQTRAPFMADLPFFRLQPGLPAYSRTGVDLFGPFQVSILRRQVKRWVVLFTCMTTRHCHLEMAVSLDQDCFIGALTRFEARRGSNRLLQR